MSKVLIADGNRERAMLVADAVRKAGFDPVTATTGREALRLVREAADIDVILIDQSITDPLLVHLLPQLRADMDVGQVPILITEAPTAGAREAAPDTTRAGLQRQRLASEAQNQRLAAFERADDQLRQLAKQYPKVEVIAATTDVNKLRALLGERIGADMGRPFTEAERKDPSAATADRLKRLIAERKDHADRALVWLGRLARGEIAGYDVKPAAESLMAALRYADHGNDATAATIDAISRLPGAKAQVALAEFVLDARRPAAPRAAAAVELVRHIQQHGSQLSSAQARALEALARAADTDATLKANATRVIGTLRPDSKATGERLKGYVPSPPPAAAPPPAKDKD
jgi:CheY-like chemotaxis protein